MLKVDIKNNENEKSLWKVIEDFKRDLGIWFILAFSGGADDSSPILKHLSKVSTTLPVNGNKNNGLQRLISEAKSDYVGSIIKSILGPLRNHNIAVLCGGTKWGVPSEAATIAKSMGFHTIGVYPLTGQESGYTLPDDILDLGVCVHPIIGNSRWCDETSVFCKMLDAAVVIGGGAGTMVEIAHLLKMNESSRGKIRHILPVAGTGGTAEKISYFPGKPETMSKCIPSTPLYTGEAVLRHLRDHTTIEDTFAG